MMKQTPELGYCCVDHRHKCVDSTNSTFGLDEIIILKLFRFFVIVVTYSSITLQSASWEDSR